MSNDKGGLKIRKSRSENNKKIHCIHTWMAKG